MKKIFTILLHPIPTRKCSMLLAPGSGYIRNKAWNTCSNLLKVKKKCTFLYDAVHQEST
jgi:hypothetical protein